MFSSLTHYFILLMIDSNSIHFPINYGVKLIVTFL